MGVRLSLLLFAMLVASGQVIFTIGLGVKSWPIMLLGRFVFGTGGECLVVANSALIADWFKDKELAFAFGVNLSVARLGSVFNNLLSPPLTNMLGIVFACWFGAILCAGSVGSVLLVMPVDKAFDLKLSKLKTPLLPNDEPLSSSVNPLNGDSIIVQSRSGSRTSNDGQGEEANAIWKQGSFVSIPAADEKPKRGQGSMSWVDGSKQFIRETLSLPHVFWVLAVLCVVVYGCVLPFNNVASSLLLERDYFRKPPSGCALLVSGKCQSEINIPNTLCPSSKWYQPPLPINVTLSDGSSYPGQVTIADVDCTATVWKDQCTQSFCSRLTSAESQASVIMSIPYIISAVMSPVLGIVIDRFGMRAVISSLSPGLLLIAHSILGFSSLSPVGPLVAQGLAYSGFAAVLWPAVPLVVEEELTGLAFGILTSCLNLATAVVPLIVAAMFTASGDLYIPNVEILFVAIGALGFAVGLYLNLYDVRNGSVLNKGATTDEGRRAEYQVIGNDDKGGEAPVVIYVATGEEGRMSGGNDYHSSTVGDEVHREGRREPERGRERSSYRSRSRDRSRDRSVGSPGSHHPGLLTAYEEVHRGGAF